ncbi:Hypothetical protein D9617_13g099670 [Elsinoe fawcettii]|nr:Hypothetical protein D9617_13g099670 [Elsinoe fawcettii]
MLRYIYFTLAVYFLELVDAQNGTYSFPSLTAPASASATTTTTPISALDEEDDSITTLNFTAAKPTRTRIGAETTIKGPTSWISTSTDWSLDLDRLFPTYRPEERSNFQAIWDCDQKLFKFSSTYIKPSVPLGNITAYATETYAPFTIEILSTTFFNAITYSQCDGVPRIGYSGGTPSFSVSTSTSTIRGIVTSTWTIREDVATPSPSLPCTVEDNLPYGYCSALTTVWTDYRDSSYAADAAGTVYTNDAFSMPTRCRLGFKRLRRTCHIRVSDATMMYWPLPSRTADFCQPTTTSAPYDIQRSGNITAQVVTLNGTEYTSPWVYITYHSITYKSKWISTYGIIQTKIPKLVLSYLPHEVSSLCGVGGQVTTMPFDFNDLEGDVPWAAYNCALRCENITECLPMDQYLRPYSPYLAWPQTFLDMLHSWNSYDPDQCSFGQDDYGIPDPPQLLTTALHLSQPKEGPAGKTTIIGPVIETGLVPTLVLPKPPPRTTSAGPMTSPQPAEPVKQPDIGDVIVSMINQPPGSPIGDPGSGPEPEKPGSSGDAPVPGQPAAPQGMGSTIASMLNQPSPAHDGASPAADPRTGPASPVLAPGRSSSDLSPGSQPDVPNLAAPQAATITLGPSVMPVRHLPNNAHVLDGSTFWAGETVTTAGHVVGFLRGGVVVDGVYQAYHEESYITLTPDTGMPSGGQPGSGPGAEGSGGAGSWERLMPAVLMVGGEMVTFGNEIVVGGRKVRYDATVLVVGGKQVDVPNEGSVRVTMEGGEVVLVSAVTGPAAMKSEGVGSVSIGRTGNGKADLAETSGQEAASRPSITTPTSLSTEGRAVQSASPTTGGSGRDRGSLGIVWPIIALMMMTWV